MAFFSDRMFSYSENVVRQDTNDEKHYKKNLFVKFIGAKFHCVARTSVENGTVLEMII